MGMFFHFRLILISLVPLILSGCLDVAQRQVVKPVVVAKVPRNPEPTHQVVFERERYRSEVGQKDNEDSFINQVVVATGIGETPDEAKLDAVRNALSQEFDQLVFAERLVVDEELERDVVISTMNGFVSDIEVVSADRDPNGFFIMVASVTVSGSALENYISRFTSIDDVSQVRSRVNADEIAQRLARARELNTLEAQKRLTQWNSAKALSRKLFDGYPGLIIRAKLDELSFNERVPDILQLRFSYQLDQTFTQQLLQQLKLIDQLVTDSGRTSRDYIYVCFSSLGRLAPSNCAQFPKGISTIDRIYDVSNAVTAVDQILAVAVFDQLNRFVSCLRMDIHDGFEQGLNSFQSKAPISRFPSKVVSWVGAASEARRISEGKTHFDNVMFLNGTAIGADRNTELDSAWYVETKAYAPMFFNEKKRVRSEHFYAFVVAEVNDGFYLDLNDPKASFKDINALCKSEGQRRHLRAIGR